MGNKPNHSEAHLNTIIGKGTDVDGKLKIEGAARVDGKIKGSIDVTDSLTIGMTGEIHGEVSCKSAIVGGIVEGNLHATVRAELQAKCRVTGDVRTKVIVIEEGAYFNGKCVMGEEKAGVFSGKSSAQPG